MWSSSCTTRPSGYYCSVSSTVPWCSPSFGAGCDVLMRHSQAQPRPTPTSKCTRDEQAQGEAGARPMHVTVACAFQGAIVGGRRRSRAVALALYDRRREMEGTKGAWPPRFVSCLAWAGQARRHRDFVGTAGGSCVGRCAGGLADAVDGTDADLSSPRVGSAAASTASSGWCCQMASVHGVRWLAWLVTRGCSRDSKLPGKTLGGNGKLQRQELC